MKALGFDVSSDIPERLLKVGLLAANDDAVRNIGDNNIRMVRLCEGSDDVSMTKKQSEVVNVLKDVGSVSVKELCYFTGYTPSVISALEKKSVVECFEREKLVASSADMPCKAHMTAARYISPTNSRKPMTVCSKITKSGTGKTALLYGVTGSGKTSVYLKLIDAVLADNKTVIVMVPEISLTPQTLSVFHSRYNDGVAVFHSALSAGEKS